MGERATQNPRTCLDSLEPFVVEPEAPGLRLEAGEAVDPGCKVQDEDAVEPCDAVVAVASTPSKQRPRDRPSKRMAQVPPSELPESRWGGICTQEPHRAMLVGLTT